MKSKAVGRFSISPPENSSAIPYLCDNLGQQVHLGTDEEFGQHYHSMDINEVEDETGDPVNVMLEENTKQGM